MNSIERHDDERLERELASLRPAPPSPRLERLIERRATERRSGRAPVRSHPVPRWLGPLAGLATAACLLVAAWSWRLVPRPADPQVTETAATAPDLSAADVASICSLPPTPWGFEQAHSISPQALALFMEHHASHLLPRVDPQAF